MDISSFDDLLQAEAGDLADIPQIGEHAAAILEAVQTEAARRKPNTGEPTAA